MIGLSITSMLLFAVCLMWRRKQKATLGLYSPTERGYPPAYDARGSAISFPQSSELINTTANLGTEPSIQYHRPHRIRNNN